MEQFYKYMEQFIRGVPSEYIRVVNREIVDRVSGIYWKERKEKDVMRDILDYFLSSFPDRTEELSEMESIWQSTENT